MKTLAGGGACQCVCGAFLLCVFLFFGGAGRGGASRAAAAVALGLRITVRSSRPLHVSRCARQGRDTPAPANACTAGDGESRCLMAVTYRPLSRRVAWSRTSPVSLGTAVRGGELWSGTAGAQKETGAGGSSADLPGDGEEALQDAVELRRSGAGCTAHLIGEGGT
ncbi:hypothetical protein NDU88_006415 [Pleurodeles waltl]|uniref:Secreted protein n=1 Tax=Pleurodeles waltl TaxID=8319 RepID=A0AAV7LRX7_PLEWA|nr:hypothetical protein NDU88_006415 [Pleurodeles waltl]